MSEDSKGKNKKAKPPFIPPWMDELPLSSVQMRVYVHLWRKGKSDSSGEAIARTCRIKRDTVFAVLGDLESMGLILRTTRPGYATIIEPVPQNGAPPVPQNGTGEPLNPSPKTGHPLSPKTGHLPLEPVPQNGTGQTAENTDKSIYCGDLFGGDVDSMRHICINEGSTNPKGKSKPKGSTKKKDSTSRRKLTALPDFLLEAWRMVPQRSRRRSGMDELLEAWNSIPDIEKPAPDVLLKGLRIWCACDDWTKSSGQYAGAIHRWIKRRCWRSDMLPEIGNSGKSRELRADDITLG